MRIQSLIAGLLIVAATRVALAGGGKLTLYVSDEETGKPIACRIHLKNQAGKPVKAPKAPFWNDHFVFDGEIGLKLPRGTYTFEIERGPEYRNWTGYFIIEDFADDSKQIDMQRVTNM